MKPNLFEQLVKAIAESKEASDFATNVRADYNRDILSERETIMRVEIREEQKLRAVIQKVKEILDDEESSDLSIEELARLATMAQFVAPVKDGEML